MPNAAHYAETEPLRDGTVVNIRALRPEDEADMLAAVERTSLESRYRRFFVAKRDFSEKERTFFMNVDFKQHVALVAVVTEHSRPVIVGGGRYVVFEAGRAEMAFVVVDAWQGRGIGSLLMGHLARIARQAGLEELVADVLPENAAMLKVFSKAGFVPITRHDPQTVRLALKLARPNA
ncbi:MULTISPECIES: GNAT family N-acetyltransferase [Bradyrhizobium]|uniref:GNAT family N-acetyltransferase n=1 Tax=Bradyrhizobium TaxID=374 RepID=UPI00067A9E56|nr:MULTISPECIES: GNAT family N-acetyltransferase [Bradyrhizobium]MDH2385018.1 GNAT family N-acetyltransferase [Bradyrhizobium sp. CER78]